MRLTLNVTRVCMGVAEFNEACEVYETVSAATTREPGLIRYTTLTCRFINHVRRQQGMRCIIHILPCTIPNSSLDLAVSLRN